MRKLSLTIVPYMQRIKQVAAHLTGTNVGLSNLETKSPDDVVITLAIRSPLCKAKKGGFKDARLVQFPIHLRRLIQWSPTQN